MSTSIKGNIFFLGDVSLNNGYEKLANLGIDPFIGIKHLFSEHDVIIGNLECLVAGSTGENYKKKPRLKTNEKALGLLKKLKINHLAFAHNHIADNLEDGVEKTIRYLEKIGIGSFGYKNEYTGNFNDFYSIEHFGKKIAILNYVTEDTNPSLPENFKYKPNIFESEKICSIVRSIRKQFDFIIAYLHWGGKVEGGSYPDWGQNILAHSLIDAGIDLIIGHHPHVIQPVEIYKMKKIYYSLGNFCFDDIISDGELHPQTNQRKIGMIVKVELAENDLNCTEEFIRNDDLMIKPYPEFAGIFKRRNRLFRFLSQYKFLWYIYFFKHSYINPFIDFFSRSDLSIKGKIKRLIRAGIKRVKR